MHQCSMLHVINQTFCLFKLVLYRLISLSYTEFPPLHLRMCNLCFDMFDCDSLNAKQKMHSVNCALPFWDNVMIKLG